MKYTTKLIFASLLTSLLTVGANAGTLTPLSEGSKITLNGNAVTEIVNTKKGDIVTVYSGSAVLSYENCKQTVPENHFVKLTEKGSCSAIQALDKAKLANKGIHLAGTSGASKAAAGAVVSKTAGAAAVGAGSTVGAGAAAVGAGATVAAGAGLSAATIAGIAAAAAVAVAVATSSADDNKAASSN